MIIFQIIYHNTFMQSKINHITACSSSQKVSSHNLRTYSNLFPVPDKICSQRLGIQPPISAMPGILQPLFFYPNQICIPHRRQTIFISYQPSLNYKKFSQQCIHNFLSDLSNMQSSISLDLIPPSQSESQNDRNRIMHKLEIFIITFLAYTSVHALRTSYSFSKAYLPYEIEVDDKYIGFIDSAMLLFLGLGNFLIAIYPIDKPIRFLSIAMILCSLEFTLIPVSMTLMDGISAFIILLILMSVNGFLQAFTWPNLLTVVHTVASPQTDGAVLGFWATNGNFGNILGFIISQYFVLGLNLPWQISPLIAAAYMLLMGSIVAIRVGQVQQKSQNTILQKNSQQVLQKQSTQNIESLSLTELIKSPKIILTALSFSLLKSVMYGVLLWLPVYFHEIGLVDYELYIPMMFDASSICGSVVLGAIFKRLRPSYKNSAMIPCLVLLLILFTLLKKIDFSVGGYFGVIGCVGLCLGGSYNTMTGLVTMQLVTNIPKELQEKYLRFYSASLMAIGYVVTALTQTIIGLTVAQDQKVLFEIFLIYTLVNLISMISLAVFDCRQLNDQAEPSKKSGDSGNTWNISEDSVQLEQPHRQIQMTPNSL